MHKNRLIIFLCGAATTAMLPVIASAQSAPPPAAVGEIVVTAQKREERLQDVPLAVSAVGGTALRTQNVTKLDDLSNALPNVNINVATGVAHIGIRGISITATQPGLSSAVAYHVDGVYVSRPEAQLDSFFDVDRLEVVRGPQGVLYGRNATAGAINVITRDPTSTPSGFGEVTFGDYNLTKVEAAVAGPIAPGISARLAIQTVNRGGYGEQGIPSGQATTYGGPKNSVGYSAPLDNRITQAGRLKVKFDPTENFTATIYGEYFHEHDASGLLTALGPGDSGRPLPSSFFGGVVPDNRFRDAYASEPSYLKKKDWDLGATATWDLSPALTITSVTGYRNTSNYKVSNSLEGSQFTGLLYHVDSGSEQYSEELRASGKVGAFSYVAGAYGFRELQDMLARAPFRAVDVCAYTNRPYTSCDVSYNGYYQGYGIAGKLRTDAYAVFGQVSYELTDKIGIDVGGRYSSERVVKPYESFGFDTVNIYNPSVPLNVTLFPSASTKNDAFTPKLALRYKPQEDVMAYASFSKGFKAGGFAVGTHSPAFLPEKLTDYEAGLKSEWFDRRLLTDISVFHYKYTNLQVTKLNASGTALETVSAGAATLYGLEASIVAVPVEDVRLNADIGLLHSRYDQFSLTNSGLYGFPNFYGTAADPLAGVAQNLKGNQLAQAPKYTVNLGAERKWRNAWGDLTLRGEAQFVAKTYFTPFNTDDLAQSAYALFNAYLSYEHPDGRWYGNLWAKNIGNKTYLAEANATSANGGSWAQGYAGAPRTFGVTIGYHY